MVDRFERIAGTVRDGWARWVAPAVLALLVWGLCPLSHGLFRWHGAEAVALGALALWVRGVRDAGRGVHRVALLGALAGSAVALVPMALAAGVAALLWIAFQRSGIDATSIPTSPEAPPAVAAALDGLYGWAGWAAYLAWLLLSALVAAALDRLERRRSRLEVEARLGRESRDAALRARLAPHFIFNALNTVKAQLATDPGAAGATVDRLASLFRQVLALAERPTIPLREELAFVEDYLGIERARLGERLRVAIEVPEEVEEVAIPPLSLQVLVENAVKHGAARHEAGGSIRVYARAVPGGRSAREVVVGVANTLAGGTGPVAGAGAGLASLRGRLADPSLLSAGVQEGAYVAEFRVRVPA